jgi:hypothetical protein
VAAKRVSGRKARMVEVVGGIVGHAEPLHQALRARVGEGGEGDKGIEVKDFEGVADDFATAFCGEALAPGVRGKAPADFDAGSEVCVEIGDGKTDVADEGIAGAEFGGAEAEAVELEVGLDAVRELIALLAGEYARHKFHDAGIGIEAGEGRAVGIAPMAENEPRCDERKHRNSLGYARVIRAGVKDSREGGGGKTQIRRRCETARFLGGGMPRRGSAPANRCGGKFNIC